MKLRLNLEEKFLPAGLIKLKLFFRIPMLDEVPSQFQIQQAPQDEMSCCRDDGDGVARGIFVSARLSGDSFKIFRK